MNAPNSSKRQFKLIKNLLECDDSKNESNGYYSYLSQIVKKSNGKVNFGIKKRSKKFGAGSKEENKVAGFFVFS